MNGGRRDVRPFGHVEAFFKRELFDDSLERAYSESKSTCRFNYLKGYCLAKAEKLAEADAQELLNEGKVPVDAGLLHIRPQR